MDQKTVCKEVLIFLGLTFGLTYTLSFFVHTRIGYDPKEIGLLLQLMMLIPAFSAILLRFFFFKASSIYGRTYKEKPRLFFYFFLLYTLVYSAFGVIVLVSKRAIYPSVTGPIALVLTIGGLLFAVILRIVSGRGSFQRAGLSFGKAKYYYLFGLLFIALYGGGTLLNYLFGLGEAVDIREFLSSVTGGKTVGMENIPLPLIYLLMGIQTVLLGSFIGLLVTFGEEYGWRGYLQGELAKLFGRVKGVLILGIIWGLWHAPVIVMGHNYPGYPILGIFLMILYCMALSVILGLAVFKSGSVWLAAFLHALNNQAFSFFGMMVYNPKSPVFSFGIGIYGLLVLALISFFFFLSKEWQQTSLPRA